MSPVSRIACSIGTPEETAPEKVRDQRPGMIFSNVSFVGSQALAEELVQLGPRYPQGVIVTQVVPLPTGQSTVGIRYREALGKYSPGEKPDFVSLEGYVTGNLLVDGPNSIENGPARDKVMWE